MVKWIISCTAFTWQIFLEKKNSTGCLLKSSWWKEVLKLNIVFDEKICVPLEMQIFISHFVLFFEGSELNFSSPKKFVKWMQVSIRSTWSIQLRYYNPLGKSRNSRPFEGGGFAFIPDKIGKSLLPPPLATLVPTVLLGEVGRTLS